MMYGGEPAPKSAPAPPPARPAGIAQDRDSRPAGCSPKMLRKPKNMVKAPSATSTGSVGSRRSANAPMLAPVIPAGRRILISDQLAFFVLVLPRTTEAVKSSASTSGIANCSGWDSASNGTEISAEPKPVIPRMKYALIRMHITSTVSANCMLPNRSVVAASIASRARLGAPLHFVLHGDSCGSGTKSRHRGRARRTWKKLLGLLQRVDRLRNELAGVLEHALRRRVIPGLGAALDVGEEIAERMGADLAAGTLQRMRGAHRGRRCALGEGPGERCGKLSQGFLELADEPGVQVVTSGGVAHALDLGYEIAIEQQGRHFFSTMNMPRRPAMLIRNHSPGIRA